ncbi:MAG: dienelactone hydrolase family protein [Burkholderiaceae bacterium]|nr:dienelactone hydrolase family protein [Burkholderiaceae bacterium]
MAPSAAISRPVRIGPEQLPGELTRVAAALGLVIFAHGSGSGRLSPRNRLVADVLHGYRLATLLFDLLTDAEAGDRAHSFDIPLLGDRLAQALAWQREQPDVGRLPVGLFGASTGAAAALCAAAAPAAAVAAVVSRGGRPDLAAGQLARVRAPTLLIVGACDTEVLALNRQAMRAMRCKTRLELVPGATHLFGEPGALETVAHLTGQWFATHLASATPPWPNAERPRP